MSPPPRPDQAAPAGERIAKVLARAGVASRRAAEAMIAEGRVQVNDQRIDSPALNVTPQDRILVDGKPLAAPEPPRLWLYHKPLGLVTSARDEKARQTVFETLPEGMPRVVSVGRLDINSEGLLLLTNDGELKRRLELPSTGWLRRYRVRVKGTPDNARMEPLRQGLTVEGERFQPMQVTVDRQQGANAWLTVGIREGKNREVRRAMEAVGLIVNRLIRTGYGPFKLGDLAPGAVEEVRPRVLRDQLGLDIPAPPPAEPRAGKATGTTAPRKRPSPARAAGPGRAADAGAEPAPAGKFRSWATKSHGGRTGGRDDDTRDGNKATTAPGDGKKPRSHGTKRHQAVTTPRKPRESGPRR
ncbi:pseudouridine synthase [Pararhodobacter sp. SW119]|uniref:pseudouridine synthase n=1 Tax=Pararhodobacter sp. SW119 TaxID=2780075 RepID=UPI001AE06193|nr:pseudouridine synthase [Pararhodobacter sp. SW119]